MKALTLPQPHASLIAEGVQWIVTREKPTDYRGQVLITASLHRPPNWSRRSARRRAWR